VLNQARRHEDVCGSGGIAPRIFKLDTRWLRVLSFTPRPLYPAQRTRIKCVNWDGEGSGRDLIHYTVSLFNWKRRGKNHEIIQSRQRVLRWR